MSEKIMMDGEPLEVGDDVYCLRRGEGKVVEIVKGHFPIIVSFSSDLTDSYTAEFKRLKGNFMRDLYWQKPEIIPPPPKRKKKVKVWDWFIEERTGKCLRVYGECESDFNNNVFITLAQKIDGTEREIEV